MGRAESPGFRTRQMGLRVVLMQTGRVHCCVVLAFAGAERKKRLCVTGAWPADAPLVPGLVTKLCVILWPFCAAGTPAVASLKVRRGTPGWVTKLSMILSTGRCEFAVWAVQKS